MLTLVALASGCAPAAPTPAATITPIDTAPFSARVGSFKGEAAVWIGDPGERPIFALNPDAPVLAASLYKLAVALHVEALVDRGKLAYADPVEITDEDITVDGSNELPGTVLSVDEALEQMIAHSDNGAALALLRQLGASNVNATLAAVGISGFHVAIDRDDDHAVSARALATFFSLLADERLVSKAASARLRERLERTQINDRLPARLPEGTAVAHKTGNLIGFTHDAGIIRTPNGARVVVVLTWEGSEGDAIELIADLGRVAYDLPPAPRAQGAAMPAPLAGAVEAVGNSVLGSPLPWLAGLSGAAGLLYVLVRARRHRGRAQRLRRRQGPLTVWSPDRTGRATPARAPRQQRRR